MSHPAPRDTGRRVRARPGLATALVLVLAYLVLYVGAGRVVDAVADDRIEENVLASAGSIVVALVLPLAVGAVLLVAFGLWSGWLAEVLGRRQPALPVRPWMWVGPLVAVLAIVAHVASVDWGEWSAGQLVALLALGALVGLTEELLSRGYVVRILREARHSERFVMVASSLLFAAMHLSNLVAGIEVQTVLVTVVYTFAFGVCMYLTMRVTGTIWAAVVVHGLTDPTTMLAAGGLDEGVVHQASGWSALATVATLAMTVFALVAIFLIRTDEVAAGSDGSDGDPAGAGSARRDPEA